MKTLDFYHWLMWRAGIAVGVTCGSVGRALISLGLAVFERFADHHYARIRTAERAAERDAFVRGGQRRTVDLLDD